MKRLLLPLVLIVFVQGYSQPYEGAEIRSKQQFQYGKFSALIKVDRGSGLINAFFTYYNDSWQNGEYWREIDWEVLGRNTKKPSHAIHFGNGNGVNGSLHQQRYIMDQGMEGNVSQSLHQDYYWYTIEWTPSRITRYIHTKDWSQNIYYHSIRTWDVGVYDRGAWRPNNTGTWNSKNMTVRFNFWAFDEPGWSGSVDESRIGTAQMKIDQFIYERYVSEDSQGHGTFTNGWTDNFSSFDSNRWIRNATHTLGDTRLDQANLIFNNGKACFRIRYNNNQNNSRVSSGENIDQLLVDESEGQQESKLTLYPNPAGALDQLYIQVDLSKADKVKWAIYDLKGQLIYQGKPASLQAGTYQIAPDTPRIKSGQYILKVEIGDIEESRRIVLK